MEALTRDAARAQLEALFHSGLAAVHGSRCVRRYLRASPPTGSTSVIAIGKAAAAMMQGAVTALQDDIDAGLLVSPDGYHGQNLPQDERITCITGSHPLPDARSLAAGDRLLQFIEQTPVDTRLLFLISGGTSSLVEVLNEGVGLEDLQRINRWLLGSGLDIARINQVRRALSRIKGGQLLECLGPRSATVLLISDVPGDDPAVIGSALLYAAEPPAFDQQVLPDWMQALLADMPASPVSRNPVKHHIIASNKVALDEIARSAGNAGLTTGVTCAQLAGDAVVAADKIIARLRASPAGLYLWGGETTVRLPENPGMGGRNQQLALAVARQLAPDEPVVLLAAGSDGRDGQSLAAGAIVDAGTIERGRGLDAEHCLQQADAGSFLQASGDLLVTGPTGTNVMDIIIAIKMSGSGN